MKHILILLIPIFLLSSRVIAHHHKGDILYIFGKYPDWKWVKFGDKETQPKYKGEVKDGKPNGLGVLTSTNGWKYFGSWKNGKIWNGTEYDSYGNIMYRRKEGKRMFHNLNIKFR